MYCPSCGTKIHYTLNKPNFCTNCGEKLNSSVESPLSSKASDVREASGLDVSEKKYLNIKKLDLDITSYHQPHSTFGEIVGSGGSDIEIKRNAYKSKNNSVLKDISESCKSSKPTDFDESG